MHGHQIHGGNNTTRRLLNLVVMLIVALAAVPAWPAEEPSEQPEERRRPLRELIYGATPEERERLAEERRRLSEAAKAFGTDPTAIIGYGQLLYQYNAYTNNLNLQAASAVVQVPITPNLFVRATLPYAWADANQPRGSTQNGTSDTVVRLAGRLYASDNVALLLGTDASFPTAAKTELGTGKYTLGPGAAVAVPLARIRSLFFTLIQDYNSIGGDPSRANIHYMQVQPTINTIWSKHWWTSLVADWDINWDNNKKTDLNLTGQVGYQFENHWNLFVGGGAGVVGRDQAPTGYDWTVNVGIRWVFRTPLFGEKLFPELPVGK